MKTSQLLEFLRRSDGETLAWFGDARLVKYPDGKIKLLGGSLADHAAAREWCSLFLHEAILPA